MVIQMKLQKLEHINYKILKDFNLNFTDKNLIVLAGNNGSGKTTILDFIYEKLNKNKYQLDGDIYFEYNNDIIKSDNLYLIANKYKEEIQNIQIKFYILKRKIIK